jgi:hypothetical protein
MFNEKYHSYLGIVFTDNYRDMLIHYYRDRPECKVSGFGIAPERVFKSYRAAQLAIARAGRLFDAAMLKAKLWNNLTMCIADLARLWAVPVGQITPLQLRALCGSSGSASTRAGMMTAAHIGVSGNPYSAQPTAKITACSAGRRRARPQLLNFVSPRFYSKGAKLWKL